MAAGKMIKASASRRAASSGGVFGGTSMGSFIKAGFGLGVGSILATIIFMLIAVALFIPGFIMVKSEQKKDKDKRNTTKLVIGYILMGLGMVLGMGFGASIFFSMLGGEF
jgi:4-hydroxybenzoate polyprenyltransferase